MKRLSILVLMAILMLSGCGFLSSEIQESVLFYYQRTEYQLGTSDGAIAAEERDGTGHITDLNYLVRLYLTGPLSEELISPFPADVQLDSVRSFQNKVAISLTGSPEEMPDVRKNLACACLALTCLDITGTETVTIYWGEETITMDRSSLTLSDESAPIPE